MVSMTPIQKIQLDPEGLPFGPVREARRDASLVSDRAAVLESEGADDQPDRQRDDERIEPENPDEQTVCQPDERGHSEAREDGEGKPVVGPASHAHNEVPNEKHHAGDREVDAGMHDHEHLAKRGNSEDGHVGKDEAPGRALQRVGRDDRRDDEEGSSGEPDRQEA